MNRARKGRLRSRRRDELEQDQGHGAIRALAERIAQDDARIAGIQPVVDAQPQADEQPDADREAQHQGLGGNDEVEDALQVQQAARLVGGLECQGGEQDVGQPEQKPGFAALATEHPHDSIARGTVRGARTGMVLWLVRGLSHLE